MCRLRGIEPGTKISMQFRGVVPLGRSDVPDPSRDEVLAGGAIAVPG